MMSKTEHRFPITVAPIVGSPVVRVAFLLIVLPAFGCGNAPPPREEKSPLTHLYTLEHKALVLSAAFSPDSKTLATGSFTLLSFDKFILLWDVATGVNKAFLQGHDWGVCCVTYNLDGTLASGGWDNTAKLWAPSSRTSMATLGEKSSGENDKWAVDVLFSPDGKLLVSTFRDGLHFWDVNTLKDIDPLTSAELSQYERDVQLAKRRSKLGNMSFSPNGKGLVSTGPEGIYLWDVATGKICATIEEAEVPCVAFSPDGKTLASGSKGEAKLWDVATCKQVATFELTQSRYTEKHRLSITSLVFAPDGQTLIGGTDVGEITLWDVTTRKNFFNHMAHRDKIRKVVLSPDGRTLASFGESGGHVSVRSADYPVMLWKIAINK